MRVLMSRVIPYPGVAVGGASPVDVLDGDFIAGQKMWLRSIDLVAPTLSASEAGTITLVAKVDGVAASRTLSYTMVGDETEDPIGTGGFLTITTIGRNAINKYSTLTLVYDGSHSSHAIDFDYAVVTYETEMA